MHETQERTPTARQRRSDLDRELVAILGPVAILVLTLLCFLGRSALPV